MPVYGLQVSLPVQCSNIPYWPVGFTWFGQGAQVIDISTDAAFRTFVSTNVATEETELETPSDLIPGVTYHWRIWDGVVHAYGPSWVVPLCPPTLAVAPDELVVANSVTLPAVNRIPGIYTGGNGAKVLTPGPTGTVELQWSRAAGSGEGTRTRVQIGPDQTFNLADTVEQDAANWYDQAMVIKGLPANDTYYWRVITDWQAPDGTSRTLVSPEATFQMINTGVSPAPPPYGLQDGAGFDYVFTGTGQPTKWVTWAIPNPAPTSYLLTVNYNGVNQLLDAPITQSYSLDHRSLINLTDLGFGDIVIWPLGDLPFGVHVDWGVKSVLDTVTQHTVSDLIWKSGGFDTPPPPNQVATNIQVNSSLFGNQIHVLVDWTPFPGADGQRVQVKVNADPTPIDLQELDSSEHHFDYYLAASQSWDIRIGERFGNLYAWSDWYPVNLNPITIITKPRTQQILSFLHFVYDGPHIPIVAALIIHPEADGLGQLTQGFFLNVTAVPGPYDVQITGYLRADLPAGGYAARIIFYDPSDPSHNNLYDNTWHNVWMFT